MNFSSFSLSLGVVKICWYELIFFCSRLMSQSIHVMISTYAHDTFYSVSEAIPWSGKKNFYMDKINTNAASFTPLLYFFCYSSSSHNDFSGIFFFLCLALCHSDIGDSMSHISSIYCKQHKVGKYCVWRWYCWFDRKLAIVDCLDYTLNKKKWYLLHGVFYQPRRRRRKRRGRWEKKIKWKLIALKLPTSDFMKTKSKQLGYVSFKAYVFCRKTCRSNYFMWEKVFPLILKWMQSIASVSSCQRHVVSHSLYSSTSIRCTLHQFQSISIALQHSTFLIIYIIIVFSLFHLITHLNGMEFSCNGATSAPAAADAIPKHQINSKGH